jgi:hypothetical protein
MENDGATVLNMRNQLAETALLVWIITATRVVRSGRLRENCGQQ